MNVVVVESPAKAKTINKYLGKDFQVLASFGHVRDLPSKDGSVKPDKDFEMIYETDPDSKKQLSAIAKALKGAEHLYLATDPDREGEAISWHVLEALRESKALPKGIDVKRVVFHEITKKAVQEAIAHPRDIDMDLVNAQQARRALDYLVGFTLSPILWRKLPGSRSAGRVQSVALRLICERDEEIEQFISREYWDIEGQMLSVKNANFKAKLSYWQGDKLEKFSIVTDKDANSITAALKTKQYRITSVEPKQSKRHPYAPFTTSTLQQEASRKLGFGAKKTMQLAQKLYEGMDIGGETVGLITYMRTDGVTVAQEAITGARDWITANYKKDYLPASPRMYKTKAKNAQEAHEAIRPTDITRTPESLKHSLDKDMARLYELIWKRMLASQMESAIFDQMVVDIESTDKQAAFHTTGSTLRFDGFLSLYREGKDDDTDEDDENRTLPPLTVGEDVKLNDAIPAQHFTEPPPRYTEASLVKKLEELGIGRPSTYASIISVLQDRNYVQLEKKRFIAEPLGRIVNGFLVSFFKRYVEYDFTAKLESELDDVSAGELDWKKLLHAFWEQFIAKIDESKKLTVTEVLATLDELLAPFIFKSSEAGKDPRVCPNCGNGRLGLRTGKFGAFIGCSNYPECNYTKQLLVTTEADAGDPAVPQQMNKELGLDPATNLVVFIKKGPYGFYAQLGEGKGAKRASLPKTFDPEAVMLEQALGLLQLPREIGAHPETGKMITTSIGRFGPYLLHDGKYTSLPAGDDVLTVGINRAVDLIASGGEKKGRAEALRTVGKHPEGGEEIAIWSGRYGPYIKFDSMNVTLPNGADIQSFSLEQAVELIAAYKAKGGSAKKKFTKKKAK